MNLEALKRFIYWITERESIRRLKEEGREKPWTEDKILQTYRFCNVRRMDDKVSQWLLNNWYEPNFDHPNALVACGLARFINLPESLELITSLVFTDSGNPKWAKIKSVLRKKKAVGDKIFNGAYMVRGNDGQDKVESVVEYYCNPLAKIKPYTDSMEETWNRVQQSYGMGSFMAGQVVSDLRWAMGGAWYDCTEWAPMGPGSKRGINRLYDRPKNDPLNQNEFLHRLTQVKTKCCLKIPTEITTRLEMIDWQNCLCEFDKYERVRLGEGRPKSLYLGV